MTNYANWSDVLGNDVTAAEALSMAEAAHIPVETWIEQQARDLYGDGPDWIDHDWSALARSLQRDAETERGQDHE